MALLRTACRTEVCPLDGTFQLADTILPFPRRDGHAQVTVTIQDGACRDPSLELAENMGLLSTPDHVATYNVGPPVCSTLERTIYSRSPLLVDKASFLCHDAPC